MAKLICIIPILLLSYIHLSSSVPITCSYGNRNGWIIGTLYFCTITNNPMIDTPEKATIDNITGVHAAGKTSDDDIAFFSDKTIQYIPHGFEKVYKNFIGLYIWSGRLKEIHQSDFKLYPKLRAIDFYNNDIDILEDGLFDFNPNLEVISLYYNKIFHVGARVFEGLTKLASLSLDDNSCTEFQLERNAAAIQAAIPGIRKVCTAQKFLELDDEIEHLEEHARDLTRENFWGFEVRFIDFEEEFRNEKFLRFLPLSLRFKFLSELKVEDLPETCKKCCQLDEFQAQNLAFFGNISNAISGLKNSQDASFADLNAKIVQIEGKINQVDGKIDGLGQTLANFNVKFDNFVNNFNNFEGFITAKFEIIESKISQIVSQTTSSILSSIDAKLRDLENRLVSRIRSNSGNNN